MDQPLGAAVGNALEVREALDTVRGNGPPDFTELVLDACGKLLALSDLGIDEAEGRRRAEAAVADGSAEAIWRRWIEAQGGTADEAALAGGAGRRAGVCAAGGLRARARRDPGRQRGRAPRRGAPHEGGRRSTTPSASSAAPSAATPSRRGRCSPSRHARTEARRTRRSAEVLAHTSSATSRRPSARCCSRSSS